jgi:hypothetical protein
MNRTRIGYLIIWLIFFIAMTYFSILSVSSSEGDFSGRSLYAIWTPVLFLILLIFNIFGFLLDRQETRISKLEERIIAMQSAITRAQSDRISKLEEQVQK